MFNNVMNPSTGKTISPAKMPKSTNEKEYDVDKIYRPKFKKVKNKFVTQFRVKWSIYGDKTDERLDNICRCPFLIEDMERRQRSNMAKSMGRSTDQTQGFAALPQIPKKVACTFNDPAETIPKGNEVVKSIMCEFERRSGVKFWCVTFMGEKGIFVVRQCVMEYYFPTASAYFHLKMLQKQESMNRFPR